ncbi:MAG: hypothetical protein COV74_01045 [Candidatus Omnitrophica bacterium CG11_big_fil_rev_8_21_14_0_20_45_26]|uniref:UDP-2,3-diacylglucosamine pyrophosphatase n=1 Tax=Candidatus Abzuiibacterium crystallinum TaxID=1974748 RepID=A0A2H0LSH5_9BACT|nr:MAG: hypothetical protein COV74_01045 [Candidatus Omnitrophica bacterium CG11_big_fil_rev_8_21_14_0_20_45_26]PIW64166.1 MAG: DUF1009 domain-containing protein [Candidatus Omnitrophica bacterium CG12_big_fil_rev_8_21_14_0_65_45_16]
MIVSERIGLIAGNGNLPIVIARELERLGHERFICALKGEAETALERLASQHEWVKLGQLKKLVQFFKTHNVTRVIMAGKVTKTNLFKGEVQPDLDMIKVIAGTKDRKDDTLLGAVAQYLEEKGIRVMNSVEYLGEALPQAGVLSKRKPSQAFQEEIEFGWKMAKSIAALDIGQTVVTKNKSVLAVESIEGTDAAILRGGELGAGEVNVIKVAKPDQDMRFDVPTVGLNTINTLIQVRARLLVIEAGKTILLDREAFLAKANEHGMMVVAKQ